MLNPSDRLRLTPLAQIALLQEEIEHLKKEVASLQRRVSRQRDSYEQKIKRDAKEIDDLTARLANLLKILAPKAENMITSPQIQRYTSETMSDLHAMPEEIDQEIWDTRIGEMISHENSVSKDWHWSYVLHPEGTDQYEFDSLQKAIAWAENYPNMIAYKVISQASSEAVVDNTGYDDSWNSTWAKNFLNGLDSYEPKTE